MTEESSATADFSGYRYVEPVPAICTVVRGGVAPAVALAAALEAVGRAPRPIAASVDLGPERALLVRPPNRVYTVFAREVLATPPA